MRGFAAASAPPARRRWKGPAVAVLALVVVVFSLLVPLAFLLGIHSHFRSGKLAGDLLPSEVKNNHITNFSSLGVQSTSKRNSTTSNFRPVNVTFHEEKNTRSHHKSEDVTSQMKAYSTSQLAPSEPLPTLSARNNDSSTENKFGSLLGYESGRPCQPKFGTYCLWSIENREAMKDSYVKRLKDQLFIARAYYPIIAKLHGQEKLTREIKQNIQDHEHMLMVAILDTDLPPAVGKKIDRMDQTIARAKTCTTDCNYPEKKLRQILDSTEDEANFHMMQSAFLYQLGVHTMPKSLHCLSMRLTVEYFKSSSRDMEHLQPSKTGGSKLFHYVIFSRNVLAVSVAINSTVVNSKVTRNIIFHIVTDAQNYYAMKVWFARHSFEEATIRVINLEEPNLQNLKEGLVQLSLSEEFRVSIRKKDQPAAHIRTEYISVFGHSHFLLSDIFRSLKKVVVLDDDVVVQRDLSPLWSLNMEGKVNGAMEFCGMRLGQLQAYLGKNNHNATSCVWMSGLNVVDLEKWREHNVTGTYLQLLQNLQTNGEVSWRAAALPASLLAFSNLIYPLEKKWILSGLGYDYGIGENAIQSAILLHYNGNMKPWLDLGIPKYKWYWKKFLAPGSRFMDECKVIL
ncbi:probable galacturonosyltransferase 7 [Musa acuminata AAA Group]|uniref:probable galacturonosyltransferase 7 n=1 Tax=Musa acuminata AAA Group TaxID=214697 RepID=UPI0031D6FA83